MRTSLNIPFQLPDYVVEKYPKFVEFIQTYYEYFATQQIDIETAKDIAVSELLENIAAEYAPKLNLNNLNEKQKRLLLSKVTDLYRSKGSIDSIKFLLAALYGAESEIILPSEFIFRPSTAKWNRDISVRFSITSGVLSSFGNFEASINHDGIVTRVNVLRIERVAANYYEAFIESEFKLNIISGGTIVTDTFSGTLQKTTVGYKVLNGGEGFRVGDIFNVESQVVDIASRIRVKRLNNGSGIKHIEFVKFGSGFTTNFQAQVYAESQLNNVPNNLTIEVDDGTSTTLSAEIPSGDAVNSIQERMLMVKYTYFQSYNYAENPTYVGQLMADAVSSTTSELNQVGGYATILFTLGYVMEYPGYYSTNDGFPSDSSYLQDGDYYQQFSYVIKTDRQLEEYGDVIKQLAHPAGLKMFGEFNITNQIDIFLEIQNILSQINTAYIDTVTARDSVDALIVTKNLVENVNILADYVMSIQKGTITENITTPDSAALTYTKLVSDVQNITDAITQKILNKGLADSVNTQESAPLNFTKVVANLSQIYVISDYEKDELEMNAVGDTLNVSAGFTLSTQGEANYVLSDGDFLVEEGYTEDEAKVGSSGGVILNPYYSSNDLLLYGIPYWSYGYTVNERKI